MEKNTSGEECEFCEGKGKIDTYWENPETHEYEKDGGEETCIECQGLPNEIEELDQDR